MTIKSASVSVRTYVGELIHSPLPLRIYCPELDSSYQLTTPLDQKGNELQHGCKVRFTKDHTGKAKVVEVLD